MVLGKYPGEHPIGERIGLGLSKIKNKSFLFRKWRERQPSGALWADMPNSEPLPLSTG
jgi:hypothetical protein